MSVTYPFTYNKKDSKEGRTYIYYAYLILLLVILGSTYLHHWQPNVLNVPSNQNVSSWTHPTWEKSALYNRANEQERQKLLAEGVPGSSIKDQFLNDIFPLLMGLICFIHCFKMFGFWMASCFLLGSFIYTGLEESMWILLGRYYFENGTYWFTKGGFWFFETPFYACVGWFYMAYSCVLIASKVFPKMGLGGRALIGGLIAMIIDLWIDPVVTSPEIVSWVWSSADLLNIFGIPHTNFVGWFLLIYIFALFWEGKLPRWEEKWGRNKAATVLLLSLFGVKILILIGFIIWSVILAYTFAYTVGGPVHIPSGW